MKTISLMLLILSTFAAKAESVSVEPETQAPEEVRMVHVTSGLAEALLSPQVASCVQEFQKIPTVVEKVTAKEFGPQYTEYKIYGMVMVGGDVVIGRVNLEIQRKVIGSGYSFEREITFTCKVTSNLPEHAK